MPEEKERKGGTQGGKEGGLEGLVGGRRMEGEGEVMFTRYRHGNLM